MQTFLSWDVFVEGKCAALTIGTPMGDLHDGHLCSLMCVLLAVSNVLCANIESIQITRGTGRQFIKLSESIYDQKKIRQLDNTLKPPLVYVKLVCFSNLSRWQSKARWELWWVLERFERTVTRQLSTFSLCLRSTQLACAMYTFQCQLVLILPASTLLLTRPAGTGHLGLGAHWNNWTLQWSLTTQDWLYIIWFHH